MKKHVFLFIVLIATGLALQGKSWKMTYQSHGLIENEINKMKLIKYADPGLPGENQIWDFSELVIEKDFEGTIENSVYSEHYNNLFNTNVVLKEFSNEFFFKGDENSLELHGVVVNGKIQTSFQKPFVKMVYPFKYGDSFSGTYFGDYYSGAQKGKIDGTYSVAADGFGTLILPNTELENVLRVTTTRSYSRDLDGAGQITHTTTRFYVEQYRFPVLVFIKNEYSNGQNTSKSYQAAYNDKIEQMMATTSINGQSISVSNIKLYPMPLLDVLNIEYYLEKESKMNIEIFNVIGEKVTTIQNSKQEAGPHKLVFSFNDNGIPAGTYYIKFNDGIKQTTKKVIAQ